MWVAMGIMLGALGLFLFGLVFALFGRTPPGSEATFNAPVVAVMIVAVLVLHQLLHAAVARALGGRPRFDLDVVQWIFPVMFVRVTGQQFSRTQYLAYLLAPLILLSLAGVAGMLIDHRAAMLILPLAFNTGMSMQDIWMAWVVWRQPAGTVVEGQPDGFRLFHPDRAR